MFLMDRLVSRSSRALAVMIAAAAPCAARTADYLRGRPARRCMLAARLPPFPQHPAIPFPKSE